MNYLCKSCSSFFVLLPGFQHFFWSFGQTNMISLSALRHGYGVKKQTDTHICHSASDHCIFPGHTGCCSWRNPAWLWAAVRSQTCCFYTWSSWCCSGGDSACRGKGEMVIIQLDKFDLQSISCILIIIRMCDPALSQQLALAEPWQTQRQHPECKEQHNRKFHSCKDNSTPQRH